MWNEESHILNLYYATEDWECSSAVNDLNPGGKFSYHMNAKDNSMGFDFAGTNEEIEENYYISYVLEDNRRSEIKFESDGASTNIVQSFEAETSSDLEMQRMGWQAILNNFKKYAESI